MDFITVELGLSGDFMITNSQSYEHDGGFENATPFQSNGGTYQTAPMHATPTVSFAFPTMTAPTDYTVVHVVREGTGGDNYPLNDTVRYRQHFGDYYAYDDGTAENGYGLTSTASRLYLAYRFDLTGSDTLTAVDLFFNRTLDDGNATIPFYLTLWSVGDDGHPSEVLYRDEERRHAAFDGFKRYVLEAPTVVDGSVFVGFEQTGNDYINLGFDRSLNSADRIWYLTGTEWQQSILSGSLMLRPCFGAAATVGINDNEPMAGSVEWRLYPNPTADMLYIDGIPSGTLLQLYDVTGRKVLETNRTQLSTRSLSDGLYLLHAVTPDGITRTDRIIIKH